MVKTSITMRLRSVPAKHISDCGFFFYLYTENVLNCMPGFNVNVFLSLNCELPASFRTHSNASRMLICLTVCSYFLSIRALISWSSTCRTWKYSPVLSLSLHISLVAMFYNTHFSKTF